MKNRLTAVLMFFVVIAIFCVIGLLGISLVQEFMNQQKDESKISMYNTVNNNEEKEQTEIIENTIEKNIVPEIKVNASSTTNPLEDLENSGKAPSTPNIDNGIEINKYFYKQLEEPSKIMYRAFSANKNNMKKGNYELDFGDVFTNILSKENGQEELGNYYQTAIEAYIYDNPDVFYLSPSKMYLNIETTTRGKQKSYRSFVNCGENSNYFIDDFGTSYEIENAIAQIEDIKNQIISKRTANKHENIKMIHDYLTSSIDYDNSYSQKNIYNIYGALINKRCVCEGYAKAFKYLLDELGIENTLVIGIARNSDGKSENHAWNYVNLNGVWYAVDVTWDDPIIIGNGYVSDSTKYKYFLKGSNTMNQNHFPSGTFTEGGKVFTYPVINASDY